MFLSQNKDISKPSPLKIKKSALHLYDGKSVNHRLTEGCCTNKKFIHKKKGIRNAPPARPI